MREWSMEEIKVDKTLDIKGIHSPRLQELTRNTLEKMYSGQILRVITDDMTTKTVMQSLCTNGGYMLMEMKNDDGVLYYTIRK